MEVLNSSSTGDSHSFAIVGDLPTRPGMLSVSFGRIGIPLADVARVSFLYAWISSSIVVSSSAVAKLVRMTPPSRSIILRISSCGAETGSLVIEMEGWYNGSIGRGGPPSFGSCIFDPFELANMMLRVYYRQNLCCVILRGTSTESQSCVLPFELA